LSPPIAEGWLAVDKNPGISAATIQAPPPNFKICATRGTTAK
jgi:hypothetical protein